jgi:hypothetical protein
MLDYSRSRRKPWIEIAAASLLFLTFACRATPQMQSFSSSEGRFSVQMPGAVQQRQKLHEFQDGKSANEYQFFVSTDLNHVAYIVMYNDIPTGPPAGNPQIVLMRIRDAVAKGKTLVSDSEISLNGTPGRAFVLRGANGTLFQMHEFIAGARLYQLIVTSGSGYTADQADAFMNSFKLLEAEPSAKHTQ